MDQYKHFSQGSVRISISSQMSDNADNIEDSDEAFSETLPAKLNKLIKLTPSVVEFVDVFDGETYNINLKIQNISTKLLTIRMQAPNSKAFILEHAGKTFMLSSGLSKVRNITFRCSFDSPLNTLIPLRVENMKWNIPVLIKKGQVVLAVEPDYLDFGHVNIYCPAVSRWITVCNRGACPVRFSVDIGPHVLDVSANPSKGRIKAYDTQNVRIQLLPSKQGDYSTEIWIKGSKQAVRVLMQVTVIIPKLVSHHPNTTGDFTLIDFPPTFLGAMRYETIVVSNKSAEPATFILLAEIRTEVLDLKAARKKNINYNMFMVNPSEGKICATEGKIFTCIFKPEKRICSKGWKNSVQPKEMDYLCFIRIIVVQVSDHGSQGDSGSGGVYEKKDKVTNDAAWKNLLKGKESPDQDPNGLLREVNKTEGLRLCLHGVVVNPVLTIVPDSLNFNEIEVDKEEIRVLRLTNSSSIRFGYRYKRVPFIKIIPQSEYIEPGKSLEVTAKISIKALGNYKKRFYFELFSWKDMTDKEGIITIGKTAVIIDAVVKSVTTKPLPKINRGIAPVITHEVGFLAEEVTFSSVAVENPRNAIVPVGGKLPKIHSKTAVIAFPNDMPKSLWSHYPDKVTRTLFTGTKRYQMAVDNEMTYTKEEMLEIKIHKEFFTKYMRNTADKLRPKLEPKFLDPYDLSCKKLYQFEKFKPQLALPPLSLFTEELTGQSLVPLTPLQLYNIKVTPRELNFEQVAVNTDCEALMYVENLNTFLILIRILPGHSGVHIKGNKKIKVEPKATGTFQVVLHTNTLGKYNGSFKYIINENHVFEMPVSGEIVLKILIADPEEVVFCEPKDNVLYLWYQSVLLKNPLKTSTKFSWLIPDNCKCFKVRPMSGTVPSLGKMFCAIHYFPSFVLEYNVKLTLKIESGIMLMIKCVVFRQRPDVFFINPLLNVGNIPLKLTTTALTTLFNAGYNEVPFEVQPQQMCPEVVISPSKGFIKPRACVVFTLTFNVVCIGTLDKIFTVHSHECLAELRVIGQVIFPQVSKLPGQIAFYSFKF